MTDHNLGHLHTGGIAVRSRWTRTRKDGTTQTVMVTRAMPPFELRWRDEDQRGIPGSGTMFASTLRRDFTPLGRVTSYALVTDDTTLGTVSADKVTADYIASQVDGVTVVPLTVEAS